MERVFELDAADGAAEVAIGPTKEPSWDADCCPTSSSMSSSLAAFVSWRSSNDDFHSSREAALREPLCAAVNLNLTRGERLMLPVVDVDAEVCLSEIV